MRWILVFVSCCERPAPIVAERCVQVQANKLSTAWREGRIPAHRTFEVNDRVYVECMGFNYDKGSRKILLSMRNVDQATGRWLEGVPREESYGCQGLPPPRQALPLPPAPSQSMREPARKRPASAHDAARSRRSSSRDPPRSGAISRLP